MAWPYTDPNDDPYGLLGGQQQPYGGLFGGMPGNDQNLALMSMGAGLIGARGRNTGEALGAGLQQGFGNLLNVSTLSGRQKALAEESAGREQDRTLRAQQIEMARQAAMDRARQMIEAQQTQQRFISSLPQEQQAAAAVNPNAFAVPPPRPDKPDEFEASLARLNIPEEVKNNLRMQRAEKMATHQPPVAAINMGPPVPIMGPGGEIQYMQPPNRPGAPPQVMIDPRTGQPAVKPPDVKEPKDPTEFQSKAGVYAQSMETASRTLTDIETKNPEAVRPPAQELVTPNRVRGLVTSPKRQQYTQAQRQWIDSINRIRSGAQLPELEYERALLTFFPAIGENDDTVNQKATARAAEETFVREAAGRALTVKPESAQSTPSKPPSGAGWRIVPK